MTSPSIVRVRVTLEGVEPEVFRILEVRSDLTLAEFHDVLQAAIGWSDSHLHAFQAADGRRWLDRYSVDEGLAGESDALATIADALGEGGGPLVYDYDFGDSWTHLIEVLDLRPSVGDEPPRLIGGQRRAPLEDSGGAHGYLEILTTLADPTNENHDQVRSWVDGSTGPWNQPFDPESLDIDRIDQLLALRFGTPSDRVWRPDLETVIERMPPGAQTSYADYLIDAQLDRPVMIDAAAVTAAVAPYRWLLKRVGDGVKLTQAGWLPPVIVSDAMQELGWESRWIGAFNREDQTAPIADLRRNATRLGLLRKQHGWLRPTSTGQRLADRPVELWDHLVLRWPSIRRNRLDQDAATLLAGELAVGRHQTRQEMTASIAYGLGALGYVGGNGFDPVTDSQVLGLLRDEFAFLAELDVAADLWNRSDRLIDPALGRAFGRTALKA